jgi:hypothetical protein
MPTRPSLSTAAPAMPRANSVNGIRAPRPAYLVRRSLVLLTQRQSGPSAADPDTIVIGRGSPSGTNGSQQPLSRPPPVRRCRQALPPAPSPRAANA